MTRLSVAWARPVASSSETTTIDETTIRRMARVLSSAGPNVTFDELQQPPVSLLVRPGQLPREDRNASRPIARRCPYHAPATRPRRPDRRQLLDSPSVPRRADVGDHHRRRHVAPLGTRAGVALGQALARGRRHD